MEKGGWQADPDLEPADRPRPAGNRAAMAGHPAGLRLGAPGRAHPEQPRGAAGACGVSTAGRPVRRHGPAPRTRRRSGGRGGPFPEKPAPDLIGGDAQLSARPVPLPCRGSPAGHQQRAGRPVRFLSLLPATHDRPTRGVRGDRGARPGTSGRRDDRPDRSARCRRPGRGRSDPLASDAHRHRSTAAATNPRNALQARSESLLAQAGSSICRRQVSFAALEKNHRGLAFRLLP
jgi:hypothetical protein